MRTKCKVAKVAKEKCNWEKIHNKKLDKLHSERRYISKPKYTIVKNIINNFSSYTLTSEEEYALSFSLINTYLLKITPAI